MDDKSIVIGKLTVSVLIGIVAGLLIGFPFYYFTDNNFIIHFIIIFSYMAYKDLTIKVLEEELKNYVINVSESVAVITSFFKIIYNRYGVNLMESTFDSETTVQIIEEVVRTKVLPECLTKEQLDSICTFYYPDFDLMNQVERDQIRVKCKNVYEAVRKELI